MDWLNFSGAISSEVGDGCFPCSCLTVVSSLVVKEGSNREVVGSLEGGRSQAEVDILLVGSNHEVLSIRPLVVLLQLVLP